MQFLLLLASEDAYAALSPSAIDVAAQVVSVVMLGVFLFVAFTSIRQSRGGG